MVFLGLKCCFNLTHSYDKNVGAVIGKAKGENFALPFGGCGQVNKRKRGSPQTLRMDGKIVFWAKIVTFILNNFLILASLYLIFSMILIHNRGVNLCSLRNKGTFFCPIIESLLNP